MPEQVKPTRLIVWLRGQDPDREDGYPFDVDPDRVEGVIACLDGRLPAEFVAFGTSEGAVYLRVADISVMKILGREIR